MVTLIRNKAAQHLLEYLLVIAIATAAAIAMHTYILRAARGVVKGIEREAFRSGTH